MSSVHKRKKTKRSIDVPAAAATQGLKRRIEDLNLTSWNQINAVEEYPKFDKICSESIRPSNVGRDGNVNDLNNLVFDLKTGKNEYIIIDYENQLTVEGRLYNSQRPHKLDSHKVIVEDAAKSAADPVTKLQTKTKFLNNDEAINSDGSNINEGWSTWTWPMMTGVLALFNGSERSFNGAITDTSTSWPQIGQCMNQEAALSFYLSGNEELLNKEKIYAHFMPLNDIDTTVRNSEIEIANRRWAHENQNDYHGPGKKAYSRRMKCTLPFYPFRPQAHWFVKQMGFRDKRTIIPPLTHIKIVLRRNVENELIDLGDNMKFISTAACRAATNRSHTSNEDLLRAVKFTIEDIFLTVERVIPQANYSIYKNGQFSTPISYSRFNFFDLPTGAQIYSPEISWDTNKVPDIATVFFVRDFDLVNDSQKNLTLSCNRFFLPPNLTTIKIQQRSTLGLEPLSCIEIKDLDENNYHDSKLRFFHLMQSSGFLSKDKKQFEDFFKVAETGTGAAGSLSYFPIALRRMTNIESSIFVKGLKITLTFASPLETSWKLVALWQYEGSVVYKQLSENAPPSIQFKNVE